jgi:WD repeat-containing protein 48
VNLGKWVLRYLFANLIDEEIRRDEAYRKDLIASSQEPTGIQRGNAPTSIMIPPATHLDNGLSQSPNSMATPRPVNGAGFAPFTPSLSIGVATPAAPPPYANSMTSHLPPTAEEGASLEKQLSHSSNPRSSTDRNNDYFSSNPNTIPSETSSDTNQKGEPANNEPPPTALPLSPSEPESKEKTKEGGLFGKKFMKMTKFPKTLSRTSVDAKPAPASSEDKASTEESDKSSEKEEKVFEDNFFGIIQKIRHEYDEQLAANPGQPLTIGITPSPPTETPLLKPPPGTTVIIQEDNPASGGVADVYRGTVGTLAKEADAIEKAAPMWLGDLLLRV